SDEQYPYPIIKQSDVFKYRNIYNHKLNDEERKQALPFPKIPPPPPPPTHASLSEALEDIIERKVPIEYKGDIISNEEARNLVKQGKINMIQEEQIKEKKVILHDDFVLPKQLQPAKKTKVQNRDPQYKHEIPSLTFTDSETGETIEVVEVPDTITDNGVDVFVNNKKLKGPYFKATRDDLKKLNITLSDGLITSFKIKIPDKDISEMTGDDLKSPSFSISGDDLKDFNVADKLGSFKGGWILIYDIIRDGKKSLVPFLIELKSGN
ncbi:MAG: hypothetical protein V2I33_22315, partial [Kangiellaceae bacterium]|nr:hypothetical protein [Kangiellaceae bacterium]